MNVELLEKVKQHILAEPNRLMMDDFIQCGAPGTEFIDDNNGTQRYPACGTAACIAGWSCILSLNEDELKSSRFDPEYKGAELLGLDVDSGFNTASGRLFFTMHWPEKFRHAYAYANTAQARAKIAAERIDHFIATEGKE